MKARLLFSPLYITISLTILLLACLSCGPEPEDEIPPVVNVQSVSINPTSLSLKKGTQGTLIVVVFPNDADNKTVFWHSNNQNVATVSNGIVTAVSVGTASISVRTEDGDKTANCAISVIPWPVASISLNHPSVSLRTGETVTLIATIEPTEASDNTVTWTTSNDSVATVSEGKVTAIALGTATITASAGNQSASCTINVVVAATAGHEGITVVDW